MPIICKISLDASEYQAQLQKVVAENKAAMSDLSGQTELPDKKVVVTADTSAAVSALNDLPQVENQSVSVTADITAVQTGLLKVTKETGKLNNTIVKVPVEGFVSRFKKGLSAVRAELNKTAGGAGKFLETFLSGGGGIGIIMAGVASLGKIVATVYDKWRKSLQENAELHSRNAASIREAAEANEQVRQKTDGYLTRLQELSNQEKLSNANKFEAKKLIDDLTSSYGDLGIKLDEVSGKIIGVDAAAVKKLRQDKSRRLSEIEGEMKQIRFEKEQQAEIRDTAGVPIWFDGDTRVGGEEEIKAAVQKIQELDKRLIELNKMRMELKRSDPVGEFREKRKKELDDLKESFDEQQKSFKQQKEDDAFAAEDNADVKIVNRQKLIERHSQEKIKPLQEKIKYAEKLVATSTGDSRVEAEKHLLELRKELQQELAKSYAWEKQISEVKKQQKQQQVQLNKSIQDQAFNLRGQVMAQAGLGKEFAQEQALRSAREQKGCDLSESEKAHVLKLTEISFNLSSRRDTSFGDLSVKTNALTARGGFQGGAALPSAWRYNKEIAQTSRSLLTTLQRIENLCKELGTF